MPRTPTLLRPPRSLAALALGSLLGCGGGGSDGDPQVLRWMPPPQVLAAGDLQHVEHTEAPPWAGPACSPCVSPPAPGCSGGLRPGASDLSAFLTATFPQIVSVSGYCCRDICDAHVPPGRMTVHGVGRALDLFFGAGDAGGGGPGAGDEVADWLVVNAGAIGIQEVIWNGSIWTGSAPAGSKHRPYAGANAHADHVHVELSVAGGERLTAWFGGIGPGG